MDESYVISRVETSQQLSTHLGSLRTLLQSCVNPEPSKSSIGFLAPLSDTDADEYWNSLSDKVEQEAATVYLWIVTEVPTSETASPSPRSASGDIIGTVQLIRDPRVTHTHRGEVAKLLVRPAVRRLGLGKRLMDHLEVFARNELGMDMLTLNTKKHLPAREFYLRRGWTEYGVCPNYARSADGSRGDVSFFVRSLE